MVNGMVTVIPAILIIHIIDAIVHTAEVPFRIALIDKRMLCPVAHHHDKPGIDDRNNKNHHRGFKIYKAHGNTKHIKGKFAKRETQVKLFPFPSEEVQESVDDADQQEPGKISE